MKEAQKYREALGLTQEEAAQLLQVPKSLIGMFEIGQRDLNTKTKLQLITLYKLVQEKPVITFNESKLPISVLKQEFLENEYQLLVLERKLKLSKNKFEKYIKKLQLVTILETQTITGVITSQDFIAVLKRNAEIGIQKHGLQEQAKLELKIKGHQFFQKELERELKKLK